jgi:hypothetical protein
MTPMKNKYTEQFEIFWKAYPRKTAKFPAFKSWEKQSIEGDAFLPKQIIGDIEKRTRLNFWPTDHSKIPHAATWLNQRRWDDEGWEDEIKSREHPRGKFVPSVRDYKPTEDDGPQLSQWERLLNVMWLKYIRTAGGITHDQIRQSLKIKHGVLNETEPAIADELENNPDARNEMCEMIVKLFFTRLDLGLQLKIAARVLP